MSPHTLLPLRWVGSVGELALKVTQELNISTNSKTVLFFMFAWLIISKKYKLQIDFISDRSLSDEL